MAVGSRAVMEDRPADAFDQRCLAWLRTDEAIKAAKRILRGTGLPIEARDLVSDAMTKFFLSVMRRPERYDDEKYRTMNVPGTCVTTMKRIVIDAARGVKNDRLELVGDDPKQKLDAICADVDTDDLIEDATALLPIAGQVDEFRVIVENAGEPPTIVSGILTVWALQGDPDADIGDAPTPIAGADAKHALLWPAIWFSGIRAKAFALDGDSTVAQRKYRSNAGKAITEALKRFRERAGIPEPEAEPKS